jgi:hypothetical protein
MPRKSAPLLERPAQTFLELARPLLLTVSTRSLSLLAKRKAPPSSRKSSSKKATSAKKGKAKAEAFKTWEGESFNALSGMPAVPVRLRLSLYV